MYKFPKSKPTSPQLRLKSIELKQYRNISYCQLDCPEELHFFIGQNAQGKTNLLESIYVTALGKSHRTRKHKNLIQFDQSYSYIKTKLEKNEQTDNIAVHLYQQGKKIVKNGVEQQKLSQYIGTLPTIMFAPEDLAIVKGSPQVRRRFLDIEIGQISPSYVYNLSHFNKILKQRNHLLKNPINGKQQENLLEILNEQMCPLVIHIWKKRIQFLKELAKWANEIHQEITQTNETLSLDYDCSPLSDINSEGDQFVDLLKEELKKTKEKEIKRRVTLVGPHRDDFRLKIGEIDVSAFGSQGQQRTAALSLKLAGIELIYHKMGFYPIVLLDDVLSELDDTRKTHLFKSIYGRVQTFVTTTNLEGIDTQLIHDANIYYVKSGIISKQG